MEAAHKLLYEAPAAEVVELQFEAIMIPASQQGYGDAIEI